MNDALFSRILGDLIKYIEKVRTEVPVSEGVLPCPILLTGTNLPDHRSLLAALRKNIEQKVSQHIAIVWSKDSGTIRNAITSIVHQVVPTKHLNEVTKFFFY